MNQPRDMFTRKVNYLLGLAVLLLTPLTFAQTVGLAGMLGAKALLIVDGAAPKTVAAGETYKGVKVVSTLGDVAVLEIGGKQHSMRVGDAPAQVGSSQDASANPNANGSRVVLSAGSGGHFVTLGQINGQSVQFIVDTGASVVSISAEQAQRMGLNFQKGQPVLMSTANGVVPAWRLKLASVRIGDVMVYDVDSVVSPGSMPYVLLGNSFLSHFQMTRNNDQMVLEKRY
jgi:aspartyl protease family protein